MMTDGSSYKEKMKRFFQKVTAAALALTLVAGLSLTALAAEDIKNGDYKATIHFHNGSNPEKYSMCDSIFAHEADVQLTNDNAVITFYVAYPIPAYPDQGVDGTIKDVVVNVNGTDYVAESDTTTKSVKKFDTAGVLFGIKAGDELATQALTVSLPRESVDTFNEGFATSAFVNVVMNTTQNFVVKITDLTLINAQDEEEPEKPSDGDKTPVTQTAQKDVQVLAQVVAPAPTYEVTIPEKVALGTLSTEKDNEFAYDVKVAAKNFKEKGYLQITTTKNGTLVNGENKLAFVNSFVSDKINTDVTINGSIQILAKDVANAKAGNYTGTVNFVINYFEGK